MLRTTAIILAFGSAVVGCGGNDVSESTTEAGIPDPAATFIVYTLPG